MTVRLTKIKQMTQYWLRRFGWPMMLGLLLIAYALMFYISIGLQADYRLKYVNAHMLQMRAAIVQRQKSWVAESPQAALQTFYQLLPSAQSAPDLLEKIFDAAYDCDLNVEKGEFKFIQDKGVAFVRYQVALPVVGSYPDVRKFVNRVLREMPSAALTGISFSREDTHQPEVLANISFTLYLGVKR